ncbi:MAG: chemotaxis protein CheW [Gammaproteobacteria bacterium]|nr:MAG: chemotaxis protein CheW [Gammaproteobacteria bacterium]
MATKAKKQSASPLYLLRDIEKRAILNAAGLPQQDEAKTGWVGIGFKLGDLKLVAPLDEVVELLTYPSLSRVPGTKKWVKGIANIRGNLLPIMDLSGYLTRKPTALTASSRILVVRHAGIYSGLLVDEVLGLKHFLDEERSRTVPNVDNFIKTYLRGSCTQDAQQWGIFSMYSLVESPLFMQVAV